MAKQNLKKIAALVAVPVLVGGWALFRPELALVNKSVNESAPVAASTKVLGTGTFASYAHETTGMASLLMAGSKQVLRLSNFKTSNGPDVRVLLVKGSDAKAFGDDYLDLGTIKGNIGDQNYELPAGVDLAEYGSVSIWCKRFNVTFGGATFSAAEPTSFRPKPFRAQLASFTEEIAVTSGKISGSKAKADLIENAGRRFLRLTGTSPAMASAEVYLVKKETFTKTTDFQSVVKTKLGTLKSASKQEFAVSKDLDLWLYRSVVLWDASAKKVIGIALLRSSQESHSLSSLLLV